MSLHKKFNRIKRFKKFIYKKFISYRFVCFTFRNSLLITTVFLYLLCQRYKMRQNQIFLWDYRTYAGALLKRY